MYEAAHQNDARLCCVWIGIGQDRSIKAFEYK